MRQLQGKGALYNRRHDNICKPNLVDVGSVVGDMLIKERVKDKKHMQRYILKCMKCGREKEVYVEQIQNNKGLLHKCCVYSKDVVYTKGFKESYRNMRNRTNPNVLNPKNECYHKHNISSDAFKYFIDFYDALWESYKNHVEKYGKHNTTLDRIDSTKDYSPENCRWATRQEQANNKSVTTIPDECKEVAST